MQAAVEDLMEAHADADRPGDSQITPQMQVQRAAEMARIRDNAKRSMRARTVAAAGGMKAPPPRPHADSELPLSLQQAELLA